MSANCNGCVFISPVFLHNLWRLINITRATNHCGLIIVWKCVGNVRKTCCARRRYCWWRARADDRHRTSLLREFNRCAPIGPVAGKCGSPDIVMTILLYRTVGCNILQFIPAQNIRVVRVHDVCLVWARGRSGAARGKFGKRRRSRAGRVSRRRAPKAIFIHSVGDNGPSANEYSINAAHRVREHHCACCRARVPRQV